MGTLYVVATPIGNLEDITLRALRVLREVGLIAAEDTRVTRKLLARHAIATPMLSFHQHSPPGRLEAILERLASADVALVTDAGTPGISDPGTELVARAHEAGVCVVPVPGPSAVAAALSASGFAGDAHLFLGFLPRRATDRRALLTSVALEHRTLVAFEAPHRIAAALADICLALGPDRPMVVARELTKLHEQVWRGSAAEAAATWSERPPRGEFALVMAGCPVEARTARDAHWSDDEVRAAMSELLADGLGAREASRRVARRSGRSAREAYEIAHRG